VTDDAGAARDRLLARVVAHAGAGGLGDVSLRSLAASIGTSHRMLIYHFGSREGLVAAVVAAIEAQQREAMTAIAAAWAGDPAQAVRTFWAGLADPAQHESERLFFEAVALALRGRPGTEGLRETLVEPWLAAVEAASGDLGRPTTDTARAEARAGMALVRGLLLDLLVTGDRVGVDAALERYVELCLDRPGPLTRWRTRR
jgi:AcrR family transcriptional regulator